VIALRGTLYELRVSRLGHEFRDACICLVQIILVVVLALVIEKREFTKNYSIRCRVRGVEYEDENEYEGEPEDELNRLDPLVATRTPKLIKNETENPGLFLKN